MTRTAAPVNTISVSATSATAVTTKYRWGETRGRRRITSHRMPHALSRGARRARTGALARAPARPRRYPTLADVSNPGTRIEVGPDSESRLRRAESALADALQERNRLWEEAHRARALQRELDDVRTMVADIQSSLSWRITTPLRVAKTIAMRYRQLLGSARVKLRAER